MRIAIVAGLAAEARIARRAGLEATATGGHAAGTAAVAERLLQAGAMALASFGIAGGLDPALLPGVLLLPRQVQDESGGTHPVDQAWRERILAALRSGGHAFAEGDILGAQRPVATAAAKAALYRRYGAAGVDLESQVVAQAATRAGRPFLCLRAIADPAGRDLPPAALVELDGDGRPALLQLGRSILSRPGQLPALLQVARDARLALASLARVAPMLAV